ncbi:hypothetical protein ACWAT4_12540 [Bradyrhizobium manausense]
MNQGAPAVSDRGNAAEPRGREATRPPVRGGAALRYQDLLLRGVANELARPRQAIEQSFLQMGDGLGNCVKLLELLSAAHEALPVELSSAEFSTAAQMLVDIRDHVNAIAVSHADEKDHVGLLAEMTARVEQPMSDLRATVRAIGQISTNARIVAAGFGASNQDVTAFTSDMASLAQKVNEAVDAFSLGYERLSKRLTAARLTNSTFVARHGNTIAQIAKTLESELETIAVFRKQVESIADERAATTSQIRSGIGRAIFALQIGDITRQRIEHVEKACGLLRDRSHVQASQEAMAAIGRLQLVQLDQAIGRFEGEVADLAENINGLSKNAVAVLNDGSNEAQTLLSAGSESLSRIAGELRHICSLLGEFERARVEQERIVDDVTRSVAEMVGHLQSIRAIEQQIRMLSFNATIQCCSVDDGEEGRGLGAVAQQLRELSNQTVAAASAIMAGLKCADDQTQVLMNERNALDSQQIDAVREGAAAAIGVFERVAGRLRASTERIKTVGRRTVWLLGMTSQRVSDRQRISNGWRLAHSKLEQFMATASDNPDPDAVEQGLREELRSVYTMEDERRTYDEFFSIESSAPASADQNSEDLDDMFL